MAGAWCGIARAWNGGVFGLPDGEEDQAEGQQDNQPEQHAILRLPCKRVRAAVETDIGIPGVHPFAFAADLAAL